MLNQKHQQTQRLILVTVILISLAILLSSLLFSAQSSTVSQNEINNAYSSDAYDLYITSLRSQVKYETESEDLKEFKQIYKDQATKDMWMEIALAVALGYAASHK